MKSSEPSDDIHKNGGSYMLREVEHEKNLKSFDRDTRLALAHSAFIMLALDKKLCPRDALADACRIFSAVFPEDKE